MFARYIVFFFILAFDNYFYCYKNDCVFMFLEISYLRVNLLCRFIETNTYYIKPNMRFTSESVFVSIYDSFKGLNTDLLHIFQLF